MQVTPERIEALRRQALKSVGAKAGNKNQPGVSMVSVSPHEVLEFIRVYELPQIDGEVER